MESLLSKPAVAGLAVLGALIAVAASVLGASGKLDQVQARRLNVVAYVVMGASMLLFALAGLRGVPG
jgi:predicted membrane channel-forming protein YqfA (hemolysin III family)